MPWLRWLFQWGNIWYHFFVVGDILGLNDRINAARKRSLRIDLLLWGGIHPQLVPLSICTLSVVVSCCSMIPLFSLALQKHSHLLSYVLECLQFILFFDLFMISFKLTSWILENITLNRIYPHIRNKKSFWRNEFEIIVFRDRFK